MDFPDFAPPRVIRSTYKRRKGRGPKFQHRGLVPSPLRNGMSISQYGSDEEEADLRGRSKGDSGTPPPRKLSQATPPTTPPRKRKSGSQVSSPIKSSPSPSKISIDREINRIFSPKDKTLIIKKLYSHNDDNQGSEEDGGSPSSETTREAHLLSPRKPSFADRMAPKKSKKTNATATDHDDDTERDFAEAESQLSEILSSQSSSQEQESVLVMPSVLLQTPSERVYGRMRSLPEVCNSQPENTKMMLDHLEKAKPCLSELSKRWQELDDLDDDEEGEVSKVTGQRALISIHYFQHPSAQEKPAVDTITGLRARGQSRRFQEDFRYLVLELSPSQSLADRRSTCVEIAKKVLTWEEDVDQFDTEEKRGQILLLDESKRSTSMTSFLSHIKTADLINQLWTQLRLAGAGDGTDMVLDLTLALICYKVVRCDAALSLALSKQNNFSSCMVLMMTPAYKSKPGGKDVQRLLSSLNQLAKSCSICLPEEQIKSSTLVLKIVWTIADTPTQPSDEPLIYISQIDDKTKSSILCQLWHQIAREAKKVNENHLPDNDALSLVAQIIVGCINQVSTVQRLDTSTLDLATLLNHYARPNFLTEQSSKDSESLIDTLCSLLRMVVALMSLEGCEWDNDLINVDGLLNCIVKLTLECAAHLLRTQGEQGQSRTVDPFTLCLALLTDFLVKDALLTRQFLLASEQKDIIELLAQLLKQQRQDSEADANSGYLAGSLAVVLALLIVGSKDAKGTSSKEELLAMEQIKRGFQCLDFHSCIVIVRDCLIEFAVMVQVASKSQQDVLPTASKAKEEEEFFVALSESLSLLLKSHSPS